MYFPQGTTKLLRAGALVVSSPLEANKIHNTGETRSTCVISRFPSVPPSLPSIHPSVHALLVLSRRNKDKQSPCPRLTQSPASRQLLSTAALEKPPRFREPQEAADQPAGLLLAFWKQFLEPERAKPV